MTIDKTLRGMAATLAMAGGLLAMAGPADAGWLRAESQRFIVYSDGSERPLRDFVQKLESYDRLLRFRSGLDPEAAPDRKLPIYLVRDRRGLSRVAPGIGDGVGGFYTPSDEDIYAIAVNETTTARGRSPQALSGETILLHEYAHHFMLGNFGRLYPAWFIEGFADFYGNTDIEAEITYIGRHSNNRMAWLREGSWIDMEEFLANPMWKVNRYRAGTYYPIAWLLTHWFMSDTARTAQLAEYLRLYGDGMGSVEAMQQATGLTPQQLQAQLRSYSRGALNYTGLPIRWPEAQISITRMPESADDLLLLGQRLARDKLPEAQAADTLAQVRRLAAKYPDDGLALLTLGHVEADYGDKAAAETALNRLLEIEPGNVRALQLLASIRMAQAAEEGADKPALMGQARAYLGRAYRLDDANYTTFLMLARSREGAEGYPNENDLATWELAQQLAPQLPSARLGYASALIAVDQKDQAVDLLQPLANNPHDRKNAHAARVLIARARGEPEPPAEEDGEEDEDS